MMNEDYIHSWFGLTYAQYLTIPRSKLQSMDSEWQKKFVELLEELDNKFSCYPKEQGYYWVKLRDYQGKFVHDEFADYNRGRRILNPKKPNS